MKQLWAPWRMAYLDQDQAAKPATPAAAPECFFCAAFAASGNEAEHLLLCRGKLAFVMLNRFPYNSGHLLVAPRRHCGNFEDVNAAEAAEMWQLVAAMKLLLQRTLAPGGFNIGINQGACAGAGVLDHLHIHLVPRWHGDTNFMPVFADCKVMPQALAATHEKLRAALLTPT